MQRAERIQDGVALKRAQGANQAEHAVASSRLVRASDTLDCREDLAAVLDRHDDGPTRAEIRTSIAGIGGN